MRLGQLARKLALRPAEIVEFLSQNNILIDDGTNTRLEDNHVALVIAQLAPGYKEEIPAEVVTPEPIAEIEPVKIEVEIVVDDVQKEEESSETAIAVSPIVDVIKAPKVELSGLKVLGKIELPEKKKESKPVPIETPPDEVSADKPAEKPRRSAPPRNDRERREVRPRKNPIAAQREREAQEEQERRQAQAKLDKERRTEYYLRKVKSSVPTKAVRLIEEPVEQLSATELREPPKTLLGKFWRWFTT